MEPCGFHQSNVVMTPPEGMTEDDCGSIQAFRGTFPDGSNVVITCWKPSKEELTTIQETGRVWLYVFGTSMPPVAVSSIDPFKEDDEETQESQTPA